MGPLLLGRWGMPATDFCVQWARYCALALKGRDFSRALLGSAVACLTALAGCASDPVAHADALARAAGMQGERVQAGSFQLTAYARITRSDQPLTVYIEGDGLAWRSRYEPSTNPTPRKSMGLELAGADRSANVVYLARPCQFIPMADNPACQVSYWTSKRFAPEIVAAMNDAVSHYSERVPGQRLNLVGYSGGGAIAVLVAARRQDVATLRTVAGNLDHAALNRLHNVSPMPESLNPIDFVRDVSHIAQIHFGGSNDAVVPIQFAKSFAMQAERCARFKLVQGVSHEGNWAALWPELLQLSPFCEKNESISQR